MIYLDHAATTPILPEALQEMVRVTTEHFANPSSAHGPGDAAHQQLERYRSRLATLLQVRPTEVIFTSGGTESCALALQGTAGATRKRTLIVSSVEHGAVLSAASQLEQQGFNVIRLPVDAYGRVAPADLEAAVSEDTFLVSILHANNEVGTLQPLDELMGVARRKNRDILFHTDAVQSFTKLPLPLHPAPDMISLAAHKFRGPKGMGALIVRNGVRLWPLMPGGGQEGGRRAGTENLPAIAGLVIAAEHAAAHARDHATVVRGLADRLKELLARDIPDVRFHGHPAARLDGIVSVGIPGVKSQHLMAFLDEQGIAASEGSACHSRTSTRSHVLRAMGVPESIGTLRLSLSETNSIDEIETTAEALKASVARLRRR